MMQIYVHGLGQTPSNWKEVLCWMGNSDECICPDLIGMVPDGPVSYEALYEAFAKFCEGLAGPLEFCGLSLGGVLALHYAAANPERVRSLVLIAPQYKMPKMLLRIQNLVLHFMPESQFPQMGFSKSQFLQLCGSMMDLDLSGLLSGIACPVLVICGDRDRANRKACRKLTRLLNEAEFQIVHGAGHEINREAPERLAALLNDFYARMK